MHYRILFICNNDSGTGKFGSWDKTHSNQDHGDGCCKDKIKMLDRVDSSHVDFPCRFPPFGRWECGSCWGKSAYALESFRAVGLNLATSGWLFGRTLCQLNNPNKRGFFVFISVIVASLCEARVTSVDGCARCSILAGHFLGSQVVIGWNALVAPPFRSRSSPKSCVAKPHMR